MVFIATVHRAVAQQWFVTRAGGVLVILSAVGAGRDKGRPIAGRCFQGPATYLGHGKRFDLADKTRAHQGHPRQAQASHRANTGTKTKVVTAPHPSRAECQRPARPGARSFAPGAAARSQGKPSRVAFGGVGSGNTRLQPYRPSDG